MLECNDNEKEKFSKLVEFIDNLSCDKMLVTNTMNTIEPASTPHDIFAAAWWRTKDDKHVECFTTITIEDLESGKYKPANPEHLEQTRDYLKQVGKKSNWPFVIYPNSKPR